MRAVKSRDTKPEMVVRRFANALGYRFRLHRTDLPGKPDLAFPARRKAVFVHGCFWHQHDCLRGARLPKANQDYWLPKLKRNVARDAENQARLREMGWNVLVIWECETKNVDHLVARLHSFLSETRNLP